LKNRKKERALDLWLLPMRRKDSVFVVSVLALSSQRLSLLVAGFLRLA
jgi:hypothetical protein